MKVKHVTIEMLDSGYLVKVTDGDGESLRYGCAGAPDVADKVEEILLALEQS